jgi:hypothetical protein
LVLLLSTVGTLDGVRLESETEGDSTLSSRSERWCLENWSLSLFVNVIRAVLRKHTPIAEETQVDRLQVRTSCVADVLRVGIQVV